MTPRPPRAPARKTGAGKPQRKTAAGAPAMFATSPLTGARIPLGAHPGNTGGKKGRSGRPPDEFKAFMRSLADRASQALALSGILDDVEHPLFLPAAKWAAEQGYGRPTPGLFAGPSPKDDGPVVVQIVWDDEDGDA